MHRYSIVPILAAAMMVAYASPANAQYESTFVSGTGNDSSINCNPTVPCRTFASAHLKTFPGGEIRCLDDGNFGTVTITRSITIDCAGASGMSQASFQTHIVINGANIQVHLRNITVGGFAGNTGIHFQQGAMLNLHNVRVYGMTGGPATGVLFTPNTGNSTLLVTNSTITGNGINPNTGGGITIQPQPGGSARVSIESSKIQFNINGIAANSNSGLIIMTLRDSIISSNRTGIVTAGANPINMMVERSTINNNIGNGVFAASAASTIRLNSSVITGNGTGIATQAGGVVRSAGNNLIEGNGIDGTPTQQASLK